MNRLTYRKTVNNVMLTLTGVFTFLTVSILFLILGYLVYNGGKSLDWAFFTRLPRRPARTAAAWPTPSWAARRWSGWRR